MSIPLDRLYHYIENVAQRIRGERVVIYRFYPHGSKKIEDLSNLEGELGQDRYLCPAIYCNDQEPLNYDLYTNHSGISPDMEKSLKQYGIEFPCFNMRGQIISIWDWALLLHSEQRSTQVERYRNTQFIPVYYWSHAVIALDWFRYAEHAQFNKQVNKTFLIYNRAWSGTREYRLKFSQHLIEHGLINHCRTSVNPVEPELNIHYSQYTFLNPAWQPTYSLEQFFPTSTAKSHYSADFDQHDYNSTEIEVVLETLFDDSRLHLTEKSLRPIACAQPFILAGTHGSLEYLRSYGFKTFGNIWDEGYDRIEDAETRLTAIAKVMQQIVNWDNKTRAVNLQQAQDIAQHNRRHFFSKEFSDQVFGELEKNLQTSLDKIESINTASYYLQRRQVFLSNPDLLKTSRTARDKQVANLIFETAVQYHQRTAV
jgi:hypothetical protein